jgi:hypothetical protein
MIHLTKDEVNLLISLVDKSYTKVKRIPAKEELLVAHIRVKNKLTKHLAVIDHYNSLGDS